MCCLAIFVWKSPKYLLYYKTTIKFNAMKKIFSFVFLALVVSGAIVLGDLRDVKASDQTPYSMMAQVPIYFYYDGQPYAGFEVMVWDTWIPDSDNPVVCDVTDNNGCIYVPYGGVDNRYRLIFTTPGGDYYNEFLEIGANVFELYGWR